MTCTTIIYPCDKVVICFLHIFVFYVTVWFNAGTITLFNMKTVCQSFNFRTGHSYVTAKHQHIDMGDVRESYNRKLLYFSI